VAARAGVQPTTLRLKVIVSTKAPPRPTNIMMHIAYSFYLHKIYQFPPYFNKIYKFSFNIFIQFASVWLNLRFNHICLPWRTRASCFTRTCTGRIHVLQKSMPADRKPDPTHWHALFRRELKVFLFRAEFLPCYIAISLDVTSIIRRQCYSKGSPAKQPLAGIAKSNQTITRPPTVKISNQRIMKCNIFCYTVIGRVLGLVVFPLLFWPLSWLTHGSLRHL